MPLAGPWRRGGVGGCDTPPGPYASRHMSENMHSVGTRLQLLAEKNVDLEIKR